MLTLCTECSRHVRADEARCPFCSGALAPPVAPRRAGRGRAALLFGATLALAACGGSQPAPEEPNETENEQTEETVVEDTPPDEPAPEEIDPNSMAVPAYGAAAPE
jgi:hypothetical protein